VPADRVDLAGRDAGVGDRRLNAAAHSFGIRRGHAAAAAVLMLRGGYVHGSKNCEDVHPEIAAFSASIPHETTALPSLRTIIKAGFGFGDVNAALVLRKWSA
jgi:3-oxoacyl-(acyl-carrier-protein) synthase